LRITPDTNLLVRAVARDDLHQTGLAQAALLDAETVVLTLPALCELAWVLRGAYRYSPDLVLQAMQFLVEGDNVLADLPAVQAGFAMLAAGGDFADGVIAFDGAARGGSTFLSFDRAAVKMLSGQGRTARLLS
jgi:predicted nucleic-acid-binding protein